MSNSSQTRYDAIFYRVREPYSPKKFVRDLSMTPVEERAYLERQGWVWWLDRREVNKEGLYTVADELGANAVRGYPLPDENGFQVEMRLLARIEQPGRMWGRFPYAGENWLRIPQENPPLDKDKIHNAVLYRAGSVWDAGRMADSLSSGRTSKLREAKELGEVERTGNVIGPLGDILKSAKGNSVTIIKAKLVRGEAGEDRVKILYIHPVRGIW